MTSILKVSEIQDPSNGNTGLTVSTAGDVALPGTVTMAAQPRFQV